MLTKEVNDLCNKLESIQYSPTKINKTEISKILQRSVEIIEEANEEYYTLSNSIISDYLYDKLRKLVEAVENIYPDLSTKLCTVVGARPTLGEKVKHSIPMLSLNNAYSPKDIVEWMIVCGLDASQSVMVQSKLDGCSIAVYYEKGKLIRALTRGDGVIGEDVTRNVLQIRSIPRNINYDKDLEIRGEILMSYESFKKNNDMLTSKNEKPFANPRNAASGTLRHLDPSIVKERDLSAIFYNVVDPTRHALYSELDINNFLVNLGLETPSFTLISMDEIINKEADVYFNNRQCMANSSKFPTDGLVWKVMSIGDQNRLANTARSPRWAIAYKFSPDEITTVLTNVSWSVGRTGKITPVAEFNPVILDGTIVSKATLHNVDMLEKEDFRINDVITVVKAAEIIPQVLKYDKTVREENIAKKSSFKIKVPHSCPSCGEPTKRVGKELMCLNDDCRDKIVAKFIYFLGRDGINANGVGTAFIVEAIYRGLIKNLPDIYTLIKKPHIIAQWPGYGDKKIENIVNAIKETIKSPFDKLIGALGIPLVGRSVAKQLVINFPSYKLLLEAVDKHPEVIKDAMGEQTGANIIEYFSNEKNRKMMQDFKDEGFVLENNVSSSPLAGMNVCITGSSDMHMSRSDMSRYLEDTYGIKVSNSVSSNTSFLVALANPTQHKVDKAIKLGIPVLNWNSLLITLKKEENIRR